MGVIALAGFLVVVFVVTTVAFLNVTVSKENETRRQLDKLVEAIAGVPDQGTFGFIGDVGRLPKSLDELNSTAGPDTLCDAAFNPAAPPTFHKTDGATDHRGKLSMGWHGPYFRDTVFSDGHLKDAWGVRIQYTCAQSTRTEAGTSLTYRTGQLTSAGPDGVFGTADDIKAEPFYDVGHFYLTLTQGGADNTAKNVTVTLYFPSNGEQTSLVATPSTVAGPEGSETTIVFASVPAGIRFANIFFGGNLQEIYNPALRSNVANNVNVKIPVGQGGKP